MTQGLYKIASDGVLGKYLDMGYRLEQEGVNVKLYFKEAFIDEFPITTTVQNIWLLIANHQNKLNEGVYE